MGPNGISPWLGQAIAGGYQDRLIEVGGGQVLPTSTSDLLKMMGLYLELSYLYMFLLKPYSYYYSLSIVDHQ